MSKTIFFVVHNFSRHAGGGVNRVVSETANELAKDKKIKVKILSLSNLNGGTAYPVSDRIELHSLKMEKHSTTQYKGLAKIIWLILAYYNVYKFYLKQERDSVWNLTSPPLIILFSLISKGKRKFINCEHISPQRKKTNVIVNFFRKFILNRANLTISLNKSDQNYYVKHNIKAKLIYNGVRFPDCIQFNREKFVIFVGRFEYQKNPLLALEIFYESELWKQGYILKFFGSGSYKQDILENAEKYGINNKISIISNENDPDKIYANASFLMMTSRYEGLPMVLIEAMARGVPCFAFDCPSGPSEIIKSGINGELIKFNDKHAFIMKMKNFSEVNYHGDLIVKSVNDFNINVVVNSWKEILVDA